MVIEQDKKVLVSIIVPFYNVEDYIEKTLLSFENQTFKNFEVILIDDGSTDKSRQVVAKYLPKCSFKSKLISQKNSGVSVARNKGLTQVSGEYFVFVDSDDILSPFYINKMYNHLKKNDALMTICGFKFFKEDKLIKKNTTATKEAELLGSLDLLEKNLWGTIKIPIGSFMIKGELLQKYNIWFADGYQYDEDIHFVWRVLAHVDNVVFDRTPLFYYRLRSGSVMAKFNEHRLKGIILMHDLEEYFQRNRKDFSGKFNKYGVARWVWAVMWQAACALSYIQYKDICIRMKSPEMMDNLKEFPDYRVSMSAHIYAYSHYAFYLVARIAARLKGLNRF